MGTNFTHKQILRDKGPVIPITLYLRRLNVCSDCTECEKHRVPLTNAALWQCKSCTRNLQTRTIQMKAWIETQRCPHGKWPGDR